ncbi:MAG: hypothetical protein ABJL99_20205 [Aliishimia sp.]
MGVSCLLIPAINAPITGIAFILLALLTLLWKLNQSAGWSVPLDIALTHSVTFFPGFPCLIGVVFLQSERGGFGGWFDAMLVIYVVAFALLSQRDATAWALAEYAKVMKAEGALNTGNNTVALRPHYADKELRKARSEASPFVGWVDLVVIIAFLAIIPVLQLVAFGPSNMDSRLAAMVFVALALPWIFRGNFTALLLNFRLYRALKTGALTA